MARKKSRQTGPVYFTTFQVAKALGVSPPTVVNWVNSGLLVAHRTPGGHRRIKREDIVAFAREHEYPLADEISAGNGSPGSRKVLIVDDDPDFSSMVSQYLTVKGGYEVEVAESGFAAGVAVARLKPQVILMDIQMEGMNGFEALRMLQDDPEMRNIPVVACSVTKEPNELERIRREAFVGFIQKTERLDRYVEVISDAINGRSGFFLQNVK
ncbi:MAG: response regulator [Myxococcota bacterium]